MDLNGIYGFKYDKRDRAFMPTSGSVVGFIKHYQSTLTKDQ